MSERNATANNKIIEMMNADRVNKPVIVTPYKYKNLPWPLNLWSSVFGYPIAWNDLPADWEDALEYVYTTLNSKERVEAIEYYYHQDLSWKGLGEIYGTTRETIRQRAIKALRLMRHPSRRLYLQYGLMAGSEMLKASHTPVTSDVASVRSLVLGTRAQNCLGRANITTIEQLTACSEQDIMNIRNMGIKSFWEIQSALDSRGLSLSGSEKVSGGLLSGSLAELDLSVRARNCLRREKIETIDQLIACTESDLARLRNMGTGTLQEIKDRLAERGLSLNGPLAELKLGERAYNCLKKAKIDTLDKLTQCTEQDLLRLRNMGIKSLCEIKAALAAKGLTLKQQKKGK